MKWGPLQRPPSILTCQLICDALSCFSSLATSDILGNRYLGGTPWIGKQFLLISSSDGKKPTLSVLVRPATALSLCVSCRYSRDNLYQPKVATQHACGKEFGLLLSAEYGGGGEGTGE